MMPGLMLTEALAARAYERESEAKIAQLRADLHQRWWLTRVRVRVAQWCRRAAASLDPS